MEKSLAQYTDTKLLWQTLRTYIKTLNHIHGWLCPVRLETLNHIQSYMRKTSYSDSYLWQLQLQRGGRWWAVSSETCFCVLTRLWQGQGQGQDGGGRGKVYGEENSSLCCSWSTARCQLPLWYGWLSSVVLAGRTWMKETLFLRWASITNRLSISEVTSRTTCVDKGMNADT